MNEEELKKLNGEWHAALIDALWATCEYQIACARLDWAEKYMPGDVEFWAAQVDLKKKRRDEFDSASNEAYYAFNEAMSK